jgi:hypothetical protein
VLFVAVVPCPPLVGRGLRIAVRRILTILLAPERGDVEQAPGVDEDLIATTVDEVGAEDVVIVVANERVGAVPVLDAEVFMEVVGDGDSVRSR